MDTGVPTTHVDIEHRGGVAVVAMNDAPRRNVLHADLREDLITALEEVTSDSSVRAVVLTGRGKCFSAGGDLSTMPPATPEEGTQRMARVSRLLTTLAGTDKPVIAAVNGPAAGVAVGLICCCDIVIASEEARFLLPFTQLGLMPDGGLIHLLGERIGVAQARRLLLEGSVVEAHIGNDMGLVDAVVTENQLMDAALVHASRLGRRAPLAVAAIKQGIRQSSATLETALKFETAHQPHLFSTEDFREGRQSFYEKRQPRFTGR